VSIDAINLDFKNDLEGFGEIYTDKNKGIAYSHVKGKNGSNSSPATDVII